MEIEKPIHRGFWKPRQALAGTVVYTIMVINLSTWYVVQYSNDLIMHFKLQDTNRQLIPAP